MSYIGGKDLDSQEQQQKYICFGFNEYTFGQSNMYSNTEHVCVNDAANYTAQSHFAPQGSWSSGIL